MSPVVMTQRGRSHVDDLRGASRLAIEATRSVTDLVQAMHRAIGGPPAILGAPVYATIRAVTRFVGAGIDRALAPLVPLLGDGLPGPEREAVLAALNGVLGDYLADSGNPLAIPMRFRRDGEALELSGLSAAGKKLLVLVHGSSLGDRQWLKGGHDHGAALARDLGYTPVYLHYNSGLHISTNGREFAALLEALVAAWPVPIEELAILGHSMGGLVARSALGAGHAWLPRKSALICLGSPHHGAPLERGGNWIDVLLGVHRYSAPLARLGRLRSAGVTDLRFGNAQDADWQGRDRFAPAGDRRSPLPLPQGVACYAVAGTRAPAAGGNLPGDGLVPVDSALGRHARPELTLGFPEAHTFVAYATGHMDLLGSDPVYQRLAAWLGA